MSLFDVMFCAEHGWKSHVFVHEAAHAVAALDRGIAFSDVTVNSPRDWAAVDLPNYLRAGGVQMTSPTHEWVMADTAAAFEFALAGSEAEKLVFGHQLEDSHKGDLTLLAGGFDPDSSGSAEVISNFPQVLADARSRTRTWVGDAYPRIKDVARALGGMETSVERTLLDDDGGPWTLTYQQVVEIAGL